MQAPAKCFGINSTGLKVLAMVTMLLDHMWATIIPGNLWLTCVGRIAFPIFAFQITEGFFHTHDRKRYMTRMLLFALVSEIPFNLMVGGSVFYPFHQNVMFTFLIALFVLSKIENLCNQGFHTRSVILILLWVFLGDIFATLAMVDYIGAGVLTVVLFYFTRGKKYSWVWQLVGMYAINCIMLAGLVFPVTLGNFSFEFPQQGFALFALIPIWLYNGQKGSNSKLWQYSVYLFYPLHMLVLWAVVALR